MAVVAAGALVADVTVDYWDALAVVASVASSVAAAARAAFFAAAWVAFWTVAVA